MKFQFKRKIGENEFTFSGEASTHKEFFEKVHFFTAIPTKGPNGEEDLQISFRKTPKEGYTYYSLICPSAGKEFIFGQSKNEPGELFDKGWTDLKMKQKKTNNSVDYGDANPIEVPDSPKKENNPMPEPIQVEEPQDVGAADDILNSFLND